MSSHVLSVLISSDGFMPHGMCYLWQPGILSLNVISDGLIALAYFSIPFTLLYFVRKRRDPEYGWIFLCFAVFIVACGCTHLMEISTIWYPTYWLAGLLKAVTALASVATGFLLFKLVPQALLIPRPSVLISTNVELQRVIGERSRAERELLQANETLERRVADRTAELKSLNHSLHEIDRMRTDFVSTVSHELRTPLTSINGSLGLLQSGAMGALPEAAANMVRIAYENSGRLVKIINDILDIGKLEAGQLEVRIESVAVFELLQRAIEANAGYAEKCDVRFQLEAGFSDVHVLADPDRLMQVVTNLLSNAAKFSPACAEVRVRIQAAGARTRVEIEDSGPGISESFQSLVFEKFSQAESSSNRRFEGTGLGLSIARMLMDAMGGTIGFTTVVGRGTIFYIELPQALARRLS